MCKFRKVDSFKNKEGKKVYNKPVVIVKVISLVISLILLIIHHFLDEGIVDRSNSLKTTLVYGFIMILLLLSSLYDLKKARAISDV